MQNIHSTSIYRKPFIIGVFAFCVFMAITQYLSFQKFLLNVSNEKQATIQELNRVTDQFQVSLNNSLSVTKTLAFIVENYGIPKDFSKLGKELLEQNSNVDAVQLLQNGVITHVYPIQGNEVVIGYNVLNDTLRTKEIMKAYEQGDLFFGGPFELRQGGMAIVGRFPIKNTGSYNFAAVIIKLSSLLKNSGISASNSSGNYLFQLSKNNPNTNIEEFFLPEMDANQLKESVFLKIPIGDWKLYTVLKKSNRWDGVIELIILGFLLSSIGGYLFWHISNQPILLEQQVIEKTKQIEANEQLFKALIENSLDAVAILNEEGFNMYASPSIISVLGYSKKEILKINLFDILHEKDKPLVAENLQFVLENPKTSIVGHISRMKHNDGTWRWVESTLTNLLEDPNVKGIVINLRDITAKIEAEQQRDFEHRDKDALINSTHDLIWSVSSNFKLIAGNKTFLKNIKEYIGEEVAIGDPIIFEQANFNKEYLDFWKNNYIRALQGEFFTIETVIPAFQNREERFMETSFNPIYNKEIIEGVACYSRDVTENRIFQKEIIETNAKLQTAQEIAKLGYWALDLKTKNLFWSSQVYTIWGVQEKTFEVTFENLLLTIHPDDKNLFLKHQKEALLGLHPMHIEHRIVMPDSKIKWVREIGQLIFDEKEFPIRFEGTVQDITEQKIAEIALKEKNQFITSAIDNLPVGIAIRDMNTGIFTLMNKNFIEIYGWTKEELADVETFFRNVYPDENYRREIQTQIFNDIESKDIKRMNWEGIQITTKNGKKRFVNAKNIPLYEQNIMISTALDVTEKILAEEELQKNNERYNYVTKATFDAIWDWDIINETIYWGEGFQTIFGYKYLKNNFNAWTVNIHPDDIERVTNSLNASIAGVEKNWTEEYRFKRGNGTYAFVKDKGVIIREMEGKAIRMIGAIQDVSQQKEYEKHILDVNEKLRNLSAHLQNAREEERITIAREIHDELGQQLTGIKFDVSWLKNKTATLYPEGAERIARLINNINLTINQVRKIAKKLRPGVLDDLGLEAAMEWFVQQFEEQSGILCTLETKNTVSRYNKEVNTTMYRIFQEALTNVMRHSKATKVDILLFEENKHLVLEILDNGKGITESEESNNLSLGITGMKERATMLNGSFLLKKRKGGGTRLKVLVPLSVEIENK